MTNCQCESACLPQTGSTCQYVSTNAQSYTLKSQVNCCGQVVTEYPRPIYEPNCCTTCANCPIPTPKPPCSCCPTPTPKPPCPCPVPSPTPKPPCSCCPSPTPKPPCPCPTPCPTPCPPTPCPIKGNAHVGTSGATLLIGGPTGTIPIDTIFSKTGTAVCQVNPLKLRGPHTYLVEWSGGVNPLDDPGFAKLELLLDGVPVPGSANATDAVIGTNGIAALSGGAIVTVPAGCHTLEVGYTTGNLGTEVSNINMRIVELY